MNLQGVTYSDKVTMNENPNIPAVNKVQAADMNELKNTINNNNSVLEETIDGLLIRDNYICVRLNGNSSQPTETNVRFNSISSISGNKLTFDQSNYRIVIGSGISRIKVSCNFMIHYSAANNNTYGYEITKNGNSATSGRVYKTASNPLSASTPNLILEVSENDYIALSFVSTAQGNQTIQSGTFLTVEAL